MTNPDHLWSNVQSAARRIRCAPEIREEVMQECAARCLIAASKRPIAHLAKYVAATYRSCVAEHYRRRKRDVVYVAIRDTDQPVVACALLESLNPGDRVPQQLDLRDAIDCLPHRERATITRYYFDGISLSAIARSDFVREGTARKTLNRGHARLKLIMESDRIAH